LLYIFADLEEEINVDCGCSILARFPIENLIVSEIEWLIFLVYVCDKTNDDDD